jgi:hypothetical protein
MKTSTIIIISLIISFSQLSAQTTSEIIDIGSGGISDISNNGIYVCGSNYPNPPYLWSEATGKINIGNVEGEGYGVSDNGIVVGRFLDSNLTVGGSPVLRAGYFANNQWYGLEGLPGVPPLDDHDFTHAYGINSSGTKVVGMVWHTNWHVEACYWSIPDTGIGLLGQTGGSNSRANVISNDGSIIAGWDGTTTGPDRRAFYWDPAPHFMGGFDPTYLVGECNGMNSDGSVIVGGSVWPFIWTEATGMQQVVADSSLYWTGQALGVSDNGIIVGYVDPGSFNYKAFIKKPGWSDIVYLSTFISDSLGISGYSNWYFAFGQAISPDGRTIGISAYPPGAQFPEALILKIDQPVPVELVFFTATVIKSDVNLNWSTATETNNSGFAVERKTQNSDWQQIGFVKGNGTTTNNSFYSFTDNVNTSAKYSYRLKQIDLDGSTNYSNVVEAEVNTISEFSLNQNYPNPFNPVTKISFTIPQQSNVKLTVYNMLGEKVVELVNEVKSAGKYNIEFNGNNLSSGTYIYRLVAGSFISTRKMILLK